MSGKDVIHTTRAPCKGLVPSGRCITAVGSIKKGLITSRQIFVVRCAMIYYLIPLKNLEGAKAVNTGMLVMDIALALDFLAIGDFALTTVNH